VQEPATRPAPGGERAPGQPGEVAIRLQGLRRDFGERPALAGVSMQLGRGETLAVLGPNGSGKTTLLRVLAGLLRPTDGRVEVLGCALPAESWKLRGRVGYLGHQPLLYRDLTARENLRFTARLQGLERERIEARAEELLAAVGMQRRADERLAALSAGMVQRIDACRAALHEPELLLLDEPHSHLDAGGRALVGELLGPRSGRSRVLVSHQAEEATEGADRVLRLAAGGAVEYEGGP
jgi:heme exporter protein A